MVSKSCTYHIVRPSNRIGYANNQPCKPRTLARARNPNPQNRGKLGCCIMLNDVMSQPCSCMLDPYRLILYVCQPLELLCLLCDRCHFLLMVSRELKGLSVLHNIDNININSLRLSCESFGHKVWHHYRGYRLAGLFAYPVWFDALTMWYVHDLLTITADFI